MNLEEMVKRATMNRTEYKHNMVHPASKKTTGVRKFGEKWQAYIPTSRGYQHIGTFDTESEAIQARMKVLNKE